MYFALTRVGLKIQDHHYILNWFQIRESHIKLKGLGLASASGKARMSLLKQPTYTGFPKRTVHEVLLKMS